MVAIGYARVSTEEQAVEGVSLSAQAAKLQAWAQLHDEHELILFEDAGVSGSTITQRPGLQAAIDAACSKKAILVVHSLSRLARSTRDTLAIADRIAKSGAELVSLSEKIDTTSAAGKMCFRLLAVLSEFERDQVSERTRTAMAHMRANRRRISRYPQFGMDFDAQGTGLVVNRGEQRVIARVRRLRAEGRTLREIAGALNDDGVPTKRRVAGGWSAKVVRDVLLRPAGAVA